MCVPLPTKSSLISGLTKRTLGLQELLKRASDLTAWHKTSYRLYNTRNMSVDSVAHVRLVPKEFSLGAKKALDKISYFCNTIYSAKDTATLARLGSRDLEETLEVVDILFDLAREPVPISGRSC